MTYDDAPSLSVQIEVYNISDLSYDRYSCEHRFISFFSSFLKKEWPGVHVCVSLFNVQSQIDIKISAFTF